MKTCTICKQIKPLDQYGILSRSKDGRYPQCKECKSKIDNNYYRRNEEKIKQNSNEYYNKNKESILANKDKEKLKEYNQQYKQNNAEYIAEYNKEYREIHKEEIKEQKQIYRKENRSIINEYSRTRLKENNEAKLIKTVRRRTNDFFKSQGLKKTYKFEEYIGCSPVELRQHIEKQFQPGMNWKNHGYGYDKWNIDHIIPLANYHNINQIYILNHHLNLKPMWQGKNFSKNADSEMCWQKLLRDITFLDDIKNGCPKNIQINEFKFKIESLTKEHRDFIKKYEWLGTIGFGVRYVFTARYNEILGGIVMIAEPNGYQFDKSLEALIQRGACAGWTPKNLGSKLIMFSCNWMVKNTSKRIFTAYSDPEAGEIGTVYQACNFDYLGKTYGSTTMYKFPNGKKVGSRHFTRTSSMKKWAKELGIQWLPEWSKPNGFQNIKMIPENIKKQLNNYAKNEMNKYPKVKVKLKGKYVLLLNYGKQKVKKTWISLPYPKRKIYT